MSLRSVTVPLVHRFTREEYYRTDRAGLFSDERVELLAGEVMTMPPQISSHAGITNKIAAVLFRLVESTLCVRIQTPIMLDNWSEPEPDIAVGESDPDDYVHEHPRATQVLLAIEVAAASLSYDHGRKAVAYAANGIPEYWIVNLVEGHLEVFRNPNSVSRQYEEARTVFAGDTVTLPNGQSLAVADSLPRQ